MVVEYCTFGKPYIFAVHDIRCPWRAIGAKMVFCSIEIQIHQAMARGTTCEAKTYEDIHLRFISVATLFRSYRDNLISAFQLTTFIIYTRR